MVSHAAIAFAKLYSMETARKYGFNFPDNHRLEQTAQQAQLAQFALDLATNLAAINKGGMS